MTTKLTVALWKWENGNVKERYKSENRKKFFFSFLISYLKQIKEVKNKIHFLFSSHFHESKQVWKGITCDCAFSRLFGRNIAYQRRNGLLLKFALYSFQMWSQVLSITCSSGAWRSCRPSKHAIRKGNRCAKIPPNNPNLSKFNNSTNNIYFHIQEPLYMLQSPTHLFLQKWEPFHRHRAVSL